MKKSEKYAISMFAIIVISALGAWFGGVLTQFGFPAPSFQQGGNNNNYIPTDQEKENYRAGIGRWNVYETVADSLDPATVRTSATNYKLYWYSRVGGTGDWSYLETGNNKYVSLTPVDAGYLWVVIDIPSGQAFYVDYQKILKQNKGYVETYQYVDVDGDGVKSFAFKYNMKGHGIPNSGYPSITFLGFILTYDASFTGLNDLANDTAIGTATNTVYYDYYASFAASKKAIAVRKIEVKVTTMDETKIKLKKLNVPGMGYLDGSVFDQSFTATDIKWTYTITNNFDNALYLQLPANSQNRFDMTLGLEYTLASSDDILVTVTVYYLVAQTEAGTSFSDTFYAQE